MVKTTALADPPLHVREQVGGGAFGNRRGRCPIVARPRSNADDATRRRPLDEKQQLRLALAAADQQLQRLARRRAVKVQWRHLTNRRSATIAAKSSAR